MTETQLREFLTDILINDTALISLDGLQSCEAAGIMTNNEGIVTADRGRGGVSAHHRQIQLIDTTRHDMSTTQISTHIMHLIDVIVTQRRGTDGCPRYFVRDNITGAVIERCFRWKTRESANRHAKCVRHMIHEFDERLLNRLRDRIDHAMTLKS